MRVVLTGATGRLGGWVMAEARRRLIEVVTWAGAHRSGASRSEEEETPAPRCDARFDLCDPGALDAQLDAARPDAVIHLAALSEVAACHARPDEADAVNRAVAAQLADRCARDGVRLVSASTDMVFDGEQAPYGEEDVPRPACVYGASKRRGEEAVLRHAGHAVVRLALMYGPSLGLRRSFFDALLAHIREARPLRLFDDEWRGALSMRTAARGLLDLAALTHGGVFHLAGARVSRFEMGMRTAAALGVCAPPFTPGKRSEHAGPEPRQRDLTMTCARMHAVLPHWSAGRFEDEVRGMLADAASWTARRDAHDG